MTIKIGVNITKKKQNDTLEKRMVRNYQRDEHECENLKSLQNFHKKNFKIHHKRVIEYLKSYRFLVKLSANQSKSQKLPIIYLDAPHAENPTLPISTIRICRYLTTISCHRLLNLRPSLLEAGALDRQLVLPL